MDAYIARSAAFARPILDHVRAAMHAACPDVQETIKWGHPFFLVDGRILGNMAAFKAHCALGFWKGGRAVAEGAVDPTEQAMGQFGRLTTVADLPESAALKRLIVAANVAGATAAPPPPRPPREPRPTPDDLVAALRADGPAQAAFDTFTASQRHEYAEWLAEAKRPETRAARLAQALEWIAEGKTRHSKYRRG